MAVYKGDKWPTGFSEFVFSMEQGAILRSVDSCE